MSTHVPSRHEPGIAADPSRDALAILASADQGPDATSHRQLLEAVGVALYTTDAAGRITYYNPAAAALWGRDPKLGEEWCGSWRLFWSDGRPMAHAECPMAIALKEDRPIRGVVATAERPDGTRVQFEPYPTPLHDLQGGLIGAVNVMVDVTRRVEAEEGMRSTTNALTTSNEALAVSNAVKDEFLGLVSHELRTPVTTIFGNARLLRERGSHLAERQRDEMLADIAEDAERLHTIIENLLVFSRLQAGAVPDREPQILTHVVRQEIDAYKRRHPQRPIIVSSRPGAHAVVEADRTHLGLLMQNLLSNADKYGGADAPIEVRVENDGPDADVRILDRGIGLDDVETSSVFDPFYRSAVAQRTAGGLGLGLSVCQRIVTAAGGRIWALPRDGGGSEFGFSIPLALDGGDAR